jgi:hypothetical protein
MSTDVKFLIAAVLAALLLSFVGMYQSTNHRDACHTKGGYQVKTSEGYRCTKLEVL